VKKGFVFLIVFISLISFAFQVNINGSLKKIDVEKDEFAAIELIPPFQSTPSIKVITDSETFVVDEYTTFKNINGEVYYKNYKVNSIEISAKLIEKKDWEIWISWEGTEYIKNYIEPYAKLFDLNIKVLELPKISTKLVTLSKAGERLPDVVMVSAFDFPTYKELGILKDNNYIPFYFDTQVVYVNSNLVKLNKLDWSIDELEQISKNLIEKNLKPFAINPISAYWFSTFLMGNGKVPLINEKFVLTDEQTIKSIKLIKKWYEDKFFDFSFLNRDAQMAAFLNGEVGFLFQGSFLIPNILEKMDNVLVLPLPSPMIPFKDYKGFATTKDGDIEFTKWLVSFLKNPLFKEYFSKNYIKFFDDYISDEIPFKDTFAYTSKIAQPIPFDEKYVKLNKNIKDILILILKGSISIEEGTKKLEEIVNNE
jgi:hypothetical protein